MIDLDKQREVSEETMALVEAVLERLEFHAFEEVLIWSEEHASKALRRCLKNTLNEFKAGKLILTSSYPKLKHYSVDSVVNGLQTALTQAQEHQDNLNEQIDSLKAQLEQLDKVWISVDFMLPEIEQEVLILCENNVIQGGRYNIREDSGEYSHEWEWWCELLDSWGLNQNRVTHWMPLPKPPVKEAEGG
ncbi:DUF551 domain-containing protein [Acinetobacter baumannii]|uniref:DUF551 domain-containing protein n=1 Tax=Acinetobacter baumannii TaxID=470 RepID=UPI0022EB7494|nr:DUF551 domain-containing protein [Acinetobacter baumannii]MDA3528725.1 DUF551 domain-containing protein [Acinetobacter baumannii]